MDVQSIYLNRGLALAGSFLGSLSFSTEEARFQSANILLRCGVWNHCEEVEESDGIDICF